MYKKGDKTAIISFTKYQKLTLRVPVNLLSKGSMSLTHDPEFWSRPAYWSGYIRKELKPKDTRYFIGKYKVVVNSLHLDLASKKANVRFRYIGNEGTAKRKEIATKLGFTLDQIKEKLVKGEGLDAIVDVDDLYTEKNPRRRRLGWKPSHDIPRRREGFHHSINRIVRESERRSWDLSYWPSCKRCDTFS